MSKRIMIVDDSNFARTMIRDILTKEGYDVVGNAENGIEAVKMYNLLKPDLVTMDIAMPELNGVEAVNKILDIDPNAKIIIISSVNSKELVNNTLEAGALDFVVKPYQKDRLIQAIKKALS